MPAMIIETLSPKDCATILSANNSASLACAHDGRPYNVPISYAFADGSIYSFSPEGQKIDWMRSNSFVSLLVVDHGLGGTWKSVVVSGSFEEFTEAPCFDNETDFAWQVLSKRADWWNPGSFTLAPRPQSETVKYVYYCIRIDEMTGRAARDDTQPTHS